MTFTAVKMSPELFAWMGENGCFPDLPTGEPAEGYVSPEGYDEDRDGGLFPVYGAYADADALRHFLGLQESPEGPPLGPASVCVLGRVDGHNWSYTPVGQHADFAHEFLTERAYLIPVAAYRAIAGGLYTPRAYLETLEAADPHEDLKSFVPYWRAHARPETLEVSWP